MKSPKRSRLVLERLVCAYVLGGLCVLGVVSSAKAQEGFDAKEWLHRVSEAPPWIMLSEDALFDLRAGAPDVVKCAYGEDEGMRDPDASPSDGSAQVLFFKGGALVRATCPYLAGTGAYGTHLSMAFVSERGVRPVEFVTVEEGGGILQKNGHQTLAWDNEWNIAGGEFSLDYKYRGAGGCGQRVSYSLTEVNGAPGFSATTIREQPCSAGPPDFEPLPDEVIFNSVCDGEPCYDPAKWPVVWHAD